MTNCLAFIFIPLTQASCIQFTIFLKNIIGLQNVESVVDRIHIALFE
jgi:hypothetical protein